MLVVLIGGTHANTSLYVHEYCERLELYPLDHKNIFSNFRNLNEAVFLIDPKKEIYTKRIYRSNWSKSYSLCY